MVQLGHLNLCIVPKITNFPPMSHLVEVLFVQQDSSSALPKPLVPFIEPLGTPVEDSIEDIHLLFHDSVSTPTQGIPF